MMNFDDNIPVYLQIANVFKSRIIRRVYKKGEKIPSVRDTAKEFKVNPNTIQNTYQYLESLGLIITKRGLGSFIIEEQDIIDKLKEDLIVEKTNEFIEFMKSLDVGPEELENIIKSEVNKNEKNM